MTAKPGVAALLLAGFAAAQQPVTFSTRDGWTIHGDLYGAGDRGVVLAHGGRFEKSSWEKQARALANAGFRALAIDLRGVGIFPGFFPESYPPHRIAPPVCRKWAWGHSIAVAPDRRKAGCRSAASPMCGTAARCPAPARAFERGRSGWRRSRATRASPR